MAKYIKQEMNDLRGTGESRAFYRLERAGHITTEELVKMVSAPGMGVTAGGAMQVLRQVAEQLGCLLGQGYSVTLEGIGSFSATLGLAENKEMDGLADKGERRNARSLVLDGVNYRVATSLLKEANANCKLERGRVSRLQPSPFSREERLQLAQAYLKENHFMRITNYMELTKQSRSVATKELALFREDEATAITTTGYGNSKLYILRE